MTSHPTEGSVSPVRHGVPLKRGWILWRDFFLRSAGFPVELSSVIASKKLADTADVLIESVDRLEQVTSDYQACFKAARTEMSIGLRTLARLPAIQEAIIWQNRNAFRTAVIPLLERPLEDHKSSTRRKERLVAQYVMRYCLKSDTIGFFGPHSWGALTTEPEVLSLRIGTKLLAKREVFFEHWCADALATHITQSVPIKPWLSPRLSPLIRIEGSTLYPPFGSPTNLDPCVARLLAMCDGTRPAKEIAAEIVQDKESKLSEPEQVYEFIAEFARMGHVFWTLQTPNLNRHPEQMLRKQLEDVTDEATRLAALASLTELETKVREVRRSAGNAESLNKAIECLETTFTQLTKQEPTRRHGQVYAGRTLVYEECRRNVEVQFGKEFLDRLALPLSLLLDSARWYTFLIAQKYRVALSHIYREMMREGGSTSIDFLKFHFRASSVFPILSSGPKPPTPPIVQEVLDEFQSRWAKLLMISDNMHVEERSSTNLSESIEREFAAPCPGWPSARYHSPDIMIAASGADAIRRGAYFVVLGELHAGLNTLETPLSYYSHPSRDKFIEALMLDISGPRVAPVIPKDRATRVALAPFAPDVIEILFDSTPSSRPDAIPASELLIAEVDKQLVVRTRNDKWSWDIIAFYDLLLSMQSVAAFEIFPPARHWPRVVIDKLVIARETWRFKRSEIPVHHNDSSQDRFLSARCWARSLGLPQFIFYKVSGERKPVYLDFASPVAVDIFANMLHHCEDVVVSEMLPLASQCWLTDSSGKFYASELRTVAVDPEPWRAVTTE